MGHTPQHYVPYRRLPLHKIHESAINTFPLIPVPFDAPNALRRPIIFQLSHLTLQITGARLQVTSTIAATFLTHAAVPSYSSSPRYVDYIKTRDSIASCHLQPPLSDLNVEAFSPQTPPAPFNFRGICPWCSTFGCRAVAVASSLCFRLHTYLLRDGHTTMDARFGCRGCRVI